MATSGDVAQAVRIIQDSASEKALLEDDAFGDSKLMKLIDL